MSGNPYGSPDTTGESPARGEGMPTRWLVKLLAVVGVLGLVVALFLPAVRTAREPARRMQCSNNLRQIALALRNYESVYHSLPPAYTTDAEGKPLHSWRTLILPYLEQQALYDKIDLSKPWDDPANKDVYETTLLAFQCPSADCPPGHTTYLAVVVPGGCFRPTEPRKLSEVTADPNLPLMVLEVDSERHIHWMSPADVSEQWILSLGTLAKPPHSGGTQAACVGGNVLFLSSGTRTTVLRALISIAGNDDAVAQEAN
jgi:hypothetical protein